MHVQVPHIHCSHGKAQCANWVWSIFLRTACNTTSKTCFPQSSESDITTYISEWPRNKASKSTHNMPLLPCGTDHQRKVVSSLRNQCSRWLSHFLQSPQVYWSVVYIVFDILFLVHTGQLMQNVGLHLAHNHVSSSSTF